MDTDLHLSMLRQFKRSRALGFRFVRASRAAIREFRSDPIYGLKWGDPETVPPLKWVRDRWLKPYVQSGHTAVEIGPGGGRWTRYMVGFDHIYAVDYHEEMLSELRKSFDDQKITFIRNNGTDFPGVPPVDFVFSFGVFVHLDQDLIDKYLGNMIGVLKPDGQVVLNYADKTKPMAQIEGFSDMTSEAMWSLLAKHGFQVFEEDTKTMWHSSLIRFGLPR